MEEQKTATAGIKTDVGPITTPNPQKSPITDQAWQEWLQPVWEVLGKIPQMTGEFFEDNKQPLISLGIILLGIISVKILIAVLDAINDIPLLAPTLQLIGMGYTAWFNVRGIFSSLGRSQKSSHPYPLGG